MGTEERFAPVVEGGCLAASGAELNPFLAVAILKGDGGGVFSDRTEFLDDGFLQDLAVKTEGSLLFPVVGFVLVVSEGLACPWVAADGFVGFVDFDYCDPSVGCVTVDAFSPCCRFPLLGCVLQALVV